MSAGRKLVIVESPAKARTIAGYLGEGYDVEASVGHIRDLPQPSELPADMKKGPFGKFAVDVDNGFAPYYVVDADKKKKVSELKKLLKDSDELFLATDEDREGEAIAWHLLDELKPQGIPVHRMVFHEITKPAILAAAASPRELDMDLVEAQEARRILADRKDDLEALAQGLLEYETLSGDEIKNLLKGRPPVRDGGDVPPTPARGSSVPSAGRGRPKESDGGLEPQPQG